MEVKERAIPVAAWEGQLRGRVRTAFYLAEIREMLAEIKEEVLKLESFFLTAQEQVSQQEIISLFDARMQATVYYTLKNIEGYQHHGWKELIKGEKSYGGLDKKR